MNNQNQVNITLEDVSNAASSISTNRSAIKKAVEGIGRAFDNINAVWDSAAGKEYYDRYRNFKTVFENCDLAIGNYITFLNKTVEAYDAADEAIQKQLVVNKYKVLKKGSLSNSVG